MRIRSQLLLVAAVVLVPGFLAALFAVEKVREAERDAALRGLRETVRATALLVDGDVQRSIGALTALGTSEHLRNGDLAAFYAQAKAIDLAPDVWTLLFDENGVLLLNTAVAFGTPLPQRPAAERAELASASGNLRVTDVFVGATTGRRVTRLYLPTSPSLGKRYIVAQAFSLDHWKKKVLAPETGGGWIVGVFDRQGSLISRSSGDDSQPARPELVSAARGADEGLIRHETGRGVEYYDAFAHSSLTGWTVAVAAPAASIDSSAMQAVAWLAAGVAVALAAALALATLLGRVVIRAVDTASLAARALGRGETPHTPSTPLHEVNLLNAAIADAGRLLAAERTSRASAESEREQLLASERRARETAQEQNAAKDQFMALLGHELRTPLAAIAGATEMMSRPHDEARAQRYLGILQRQSRHLRHIVDDLLEVSRMLSGKIELAREPLDLAEAVSRCVDAMRASDRAAGYHFVLDVEEVWVDGDPVRIEQIVNNLVTNALKYSPNFGEVRVRVRAEGAWALAEISDRGSGISAELMPRVFEPFVQGPPVAGRAASGLGIGLALVKQLVELHGGSVVGRSAGAGQGATFVVTLPRAERVDRVDVAAAALPRSAGHVLLVEDNPDARETTAELLRMTGYEVDEAGDGREALEALATGLPDVVVMDIGLPDRDGYSLAAELRADPRFARVPLIALTGYGQARDRASAERAGFDEHLVKPVAPEVLARAIKAQIERAARAAP